MRVFNPEKELGKIKNGNKKKAIISICALLAVGILGYSFALYQVRHTQKLVFNTVDEFKKRDIYLSVLVNGETQNEFPNQEDGYAFSGYECDGDATVTFDPDKWMASVNSNGPDKCTIKFGAKNINYDTIRVSEDVVVDDTNDVNLRYIGSDPSNYIWFNCLKYDDLTNENAEDEQHKCERWRIIGLMNNMTIVNEDTNEETNNQSLIKIIRSEKIGNIPWNTIYAKNNWAEASLQKGLNGPYLDNTDDGSWIISDEYKYSGSNNTIAGNYKSITSTTLEMIENTKWNIGGCSGSDLTPLAFYKCERGKERTESNPITWNGKIALMYVSDYGFATDGGNNGKDRNTCLATGLYLDFRDCRFKDWLLFGERLYTLTIITGHSVYEREDVGYVDAFGVGLAIAEFPTLYLKSNVKILDGEGTNENPYVINVE